MKREREGERERVMCSIYINPRFAWLIVGGYIPCFCSSHELIPISEVPERNQLDLTLGQVSHGKSSLAMENFLHRGLKLAVLAMPRLITGAICLIIYTYT